jgi:ribosome biogenesis protein BMS1
MHFTTGSGDRDDGDEEYGDFEDLEKGEGSKVDGENEGDNDALTPEETLEQKKETLKRKFDAMYDGEEEDNKSNLFESAKEEMAKQQQVNSKEFEDDDVELRAQVEGRRAGSYVRIIFENMPCEFIENFDPSFPMVVGGLLPSEETFGFVQVIVN